MGRKALFGSAHPFSTASGPPNAQVSQDSASSWYVLQTRSRQEKILAHDLRIRGTDHYLPLIRQIRYYGTRKVVVEVPLFSGYVFVHGTLDQVYEADRTKRVAQIISVNNQRQLNWELRNLRLALEADAPLDLYPFLKKGVLVEVRSGPFKGIQGVVEDRVNADRLILQVETLGRAVSLEVDASLLEVLDRRPGV